MTINGTAKALDDTSVVSSVINTILADMIFVKGDTFIMGCNAKKSKSKCEQGELPMHKVILGDYYVSKYEVTQHEWTTIMDTNPSYFKNCQNCPVEEVSYIDVLKFIDKLNTLTNKKYRLLTEAEWEFAAKGGAYTHGFLYSGSNNIDSVAWNEHNSSRKTHVVGSKKMNELGIFDMSGNLWEWCSDWYGATYYSHSPDLNPKGPANGTYRVMRGGSLLYSISYCTVSLRGYDFPYGGGNRTGFRLAMDN